MRNTEISPFGLSVVIPVYMAEKILPELCSRMDKVFEQMPSKCELILVEDYSPDNSWEAIEDLSQEYDFIKGIKLSRNFGQHYAITAGLEHANADWVVVMDCDLQDPPEEIINLYNRALEGYDIVQAQRRNRKDSFGKRMGSKLFYSIFSFLTDSKLDCSIGNFGIYKRSVIHAISEMGDSIRFFPTMVQWVGFRRAVQPIEHASRSEGRSSYNLSKLLTLAFNNMIAFSDKPLRLIIYMGIFISFLAMIVAAVFFIKYLRGEVLVLGYASLILSIWFLGGITIFVMGMLGVYVGKIFHKVKGRPDYIIQERLNINK